LTVWVAADVDPDDDELPGAAEAIAHPKLIVTMVPTPRAAAKPPTRPTHVRKFGPTAARCPSTVTTPSRWTTPCDAIRTLCGSMSHQQLA
jgi:hypothetical protein